MQICLLKEITKSSVPFSVIFIPDYVNFFQNILSLRNISDGSGICIGGGGGNYF